MLAKESTDSAPAASDGGAPLQILGIISLHIIIRVLQYIWQNWYHVVFFAEPEVALPHNPAPEEAEDNATRRTSTGSRLSNYGISPQTQGAIMISNFEYIKIMK